MSFGQGYALIIGVGSYEAGGRWDAPVTVGDAEGVATALSDPKVAGYPSAQVQLLHDIGATLSEVTHALDALAIAAGEQDTALVFFAGHGVLGDDGQYYLTTHDTAFSPGGLALQGTGLAEPVLLEKLRAIKSEKLLFVVNACLSGHIGAALGPSPATLGAPPTYSQTDRILSTGGGRAVVTASNPTQSSYFNPGDPSATLFGRAVRDGLRGQAAMAGAQFIGLFDLYKYVWTTVRDGAPALGGEQEPEISLAHGVGPFPVALCQGDRGDELGLGAGASLDALPKGAPARMVDAGVGRAAIVAGPGQAEAVRPEEKSMFNFGRARIGTFSIGGDVAGRDIFKVTVTTAEAAHANSSLGLQELIASTRADAERLEGLAEGKVEDIADELSKAERAVSHDDRSRLVDKLASAQQLLLDAGPTASGAVDLADTVGVLLQRARQIG